jgi:uncharacterized protein (TIGR00299 family) protein
MKIAYFDCFAGIAGDMALAALLDCGVPLEELKRGLASLPVSGWDISAEDVLRGGIHAKNVRVTLHGKSDEDEALEQASHAHHPPSPTEHSHHHHGAHHRHHHETETHAHAHGRSMREIRELIEASALSPRVQQLSLAIFFEVARAEAKIHHSTPDEIHFHEIGGLDSLLDICGVAWCLEYLGVEEIHSSALPHSSGFVDCAHGRMPVPAPATLEILKNAPWTPTELNGELVTPTGAALVALSKSFGAMPVMKPQRIGFGAGKKMLADRPNLLRVVIGEKLAPQKAVPDGLHTETLAVIECNIDDMNPEFYEPVCEKLWEAGALDVWLQPLQMKKLRPGVLLGVLCAPELRAPLATIVLRETTTLGVRTREVERWSVPRSSRSVATSFGEVRVKIADWPEGVVWRATPEYSDVARLAREFNVPAHEVSTAAIAAAQKARE